MNKKLLHSCDYKQKMNTHKIQIHCNDDDEGDDDDDDDDDA